MALYEAHGLRDHPLAAFPLEQLGILRAEAKLEEALPYLERALAIRAAALHDGNPWLSLSRNNVANALVRAGRKAEALPLLEANATTARAHGLDEDGALAASLYQLARLQQERGELDAAADLADDALRRLRHLHPRGHPTLRAALLLRATLCDALDEPSLAADLRAEAH